MLSASSDNSLLNTVERANRTGLNFSIIGIKFVGVIVKIEG